jgi:phospholipid/cholesterol/gamma-HCH transport system permease protein
MRARPSPAGERGGIAVSRGSDGTLLVTLSGAWRLAGHIPSTEEVERALGSGTVRGVAFDTRQLTHWDTSVVTFLARVYDRCEALHLPVDESGLKPGLQRLLDLAEAVPEKAGARRKEVHQSLSERVGGATLAALAGDRDALAFIGEATMSVGRLLTGRARFRMSDLMLIIQEAGAQALPIVTLISVLIGMILAFVGAVQLQRFGASIYVADLVAIAMVREMGCIMTGIIMAGRTGSGFAAQIGSMKVTQELDALATFALPPIDFIVLPRMIALSLMMPLLCIYSDLLGMLGGALVAIGMLDLTVAQYWNETRQAVTLSSYSMGIGKSAVFGVLVAVSGCLRGIESGRSSSAVGDAATSAVVTGIVLIIVADGLFAVIFNVLGI